MKNVIISLLGIMLICSCSNESQSDGNNGASEDNSMEQKENVAGGWSEAAVDQDVKEAVSFALGEISPNAQLKKLINARKQVVKGLNYDLTFSLENGETSNVIVYRDLDGNFSPYPSITQVRFPAINASRSPSPRS